VYLDGTNRSRHDAVSASLLQTPFPAVVRSTTRISDCLALPPFT
jgi:hypothetical protein